LAAIFLQGAGGQGSGVGSLAVPFPVDVTPGSLLVVGCAAATTDLLAAQTTDSLGSAYAQAVALTGGFETGAGWGVAPLALHYARATVGGPCTVTLDVGATEDLALAIAEFAPANEADLLMPFAPDYLLEQPDGESVEVYLDLLAVSGLLVGVGSGFPYLRDVPYGGDFSLHPPSHLVYAWGHAAPFAFAMAYQHAEGPGLKALAWTLTNPGSPAVAEAYMVVCGFQSIGRDPVFPDYRRFPKRPVG